ncbi:uncharacterized protein LOC135377091 [Ornithodoros turicata]|uniref:uncharacterized protein LOC135377091 n=1 Tax=Ornithodoros turicata TaxID=34597 RepID=UPI00313886D9
MASVSCLVVVQSADIARKLTLQDPRLSVLKDAVRACSLLSSTVNADKDRFQIFDEAFNRNIDLADDDVIPDKAQIYVITTERPVPPHLVSSEPNENIQASSLAQSHSGDNDDDRDGRGYAAPDFSRLNIKLGEPILTPSVHRKIVEALYQSMICCTIYPTAKFYAKVAALLVSEYGTLADSSGSGYENTDSILNTSNAQGNEAWLLNEYMKQKPDVPQMLVRLRDTFQDRTRKMKANRVLCSVKEFPYVMDFKMFMHEFELLTRRDAAKAVEAGILKVLSIASKKELRCPQEIRMEILELDRFQGCDRRKRHLQALLATKTLCDIFKEKKAMGSLFVHESSEKMPPTPHISYTGSSLEDAQILKLVVEHSPLYHVVEGMEGLASILAAYWVFNASYSFHHHKTIFFLNTLSDYRAHLSVHLWHHFVKNMDCMVFHSQHSLVIHTKRRQVSRTRFAKQYSCSRV